jgi:hypothetical protein
MSLLESTLLVVDGSSNGVAVCGRGSGKDSSHLPLSHGDSSAHTMMGLLSIKWADTGSNDL